MAAASLAGSSNPKTLDFLLFLRAKVPESSAIST